MFLRRIRRQNIYISLLVFSFVLLLCKLFLSISSLYQNKNTVAINPALLEDFPTNYVYKKKAPPLKLKSAPGLVETFLSAKIFVKDSLSFKEVENNFFSYLETKEVICDDNRRLGNQHEGGWNVCNSPPFTLEKSCLVYSFGIGEDWRFEDDIHDIYGCQVMAYDPSIRLIEHNRTDGMWFKPLGLAPNNGVTTKKWKMRTFKQFLHYEGHTETVIDFLKFDIEYMEWAVILNMIIDGSLRNVKQLAFEIHLKHPTETPSSQLHINKTEFIEKYNILKSLQDFGFVKFDYRKNPFCGYKSNVTDLLRSRCYELHYINMAFVKKHHFKERRENKMPLLA